MPEAGPYGITQFDAAGVMNAYQTGQENRIRSLILQKQIKKMDHDAANSTSIQKAVAAYMSPDKTSEASPQAQTGVSAPPTPSAPVAAVAGPSPSAASTAYADPLAPLPDAPAATAAASTAAPAPSAAQPAPSAPQHSAADREKLFSTLITIDPTTAGQYMDAFAKMDKTQADQFAEKNSRIMQIAGGLMQVDQGQRKAALQEAAPELENLGFTPDKIANFDPTDQNLRSLVVGHMDAQKIAEFVKPDLMTVGNSVIDKAHPENGAVFTAPTDYHNFTIQNADGTSSAYGFDPKTGHAFQLTDGGLPDTGGGGSAAGGFDNAIQHVLAHEGGYNPHDMNGAPVNFGINAKANAGELAKLGVSDIKDLTRDQAVQIYKDKYWGASGAENLPANLQTPYFDVYIRNPAFAKKALADSGGDPAAFMNKASAYFQGLASKPSGAKYGKAWANRDAENMRMATGGSAGGAAPITGKPLSPNAGADETSKFIGQQVALGQPMPPLGMGKEAAAMRRQILAEATKQWKLMGITPGEANVIAAQNKSGLAELAKIAQMKATVQTAENTASANATQVLDLLGAAGSTGSPVFNSWQQAGRRATGNANVSAFDVAVKTLSTEYARVMSGGNSAQLSDAARHEADALIHTSMTPDQFRSTIHQMKIDMANRSKGIEEERQSTLQQIRSGGQSTGEHWVTLPSGLKVRRVN
jgi:hypothetical protein